MDRPGSPNGGDFCCTEEELFESFMEIVNDPELQGRSNNQGESGVDSGQSKNVVNNSVSDKKSDDRGATIEGEGNNKSACNLITSDAGSVKCLDQVVLEGDDSSDKVHDSHITEISERNSVLDQNHVNPQASSDNHANENASQNGLTDLTNQVELSDSADEHLSEVKYDSGTGAQDALVSLADKDDPEISDTEQHSTGQTELQNLQSTESNKDQSSISIENKEQNNSNSDTKPTNQSEPPVGLGSDSDVEGAGLMLVQQPANESKAEVISSILVPQPSKKKKAKEAGSMSVQQPTSQSKAEIVSSILVQQPSKKKKAKEAGSTSGQHPTNQSEEGVSSTNENEGEGANSTSIQQATNQSEEVSPTNQSELQIIENDIEEGIRKANQVCEELNAITQRLSMSSDELLGDNDAESQTSDSSTTVTNAEPEVAGNTDPEVVGNTELSQNNNILKSKVETDSNENVDANHKSESDDNEVTNGDLTSDPTERPNTLPKLIVTSQANNSAPPVPLKGTTPSSLGTTPSPSLDPSISPLGNSPTHIVHLNKEPLDRKPSMSDSLDSSEGSLSGDTKSLGASPSPTGGHGPINWEILNTAFDDPDTEEDEGVYESSGHYGGFGLVLDDHSPDTLAMNDVRFRSVSQSSTISEVEFKEEYKKQHTVGSLERKTDGTLCSGYLFKLGGTGITPKNWRKRWCVLRQDRCLYYYKSGRDKVPCGIVVLASYIVSHSSEYNKKHCIKLCKGGGRTYFFCSDTPKDMLRWMEALRKAAENKEEGTSFVIRHEIIHNVAIPALSIKKPDCHGYLTKQGAKSTRSWKRRYCVLKNGCLYYYREMADTTALGVAKLHGYTVDEATGRRNGFRCVPPHSGMRTFTFIADNDYDKKRWIPCFKESIRANTST